MRGRKCESKGGVVGAEERASTRRACQHAAGVPSTRPASRARRVSPERERRIQIKNGPGTRLQVPERPARANTPDFVPECAGGPPKALHSVHTGAASAAASARTLSFVLAFPMLGNAIACLPPNCCFALPMILDYHEPASQSVLTLSAAIWNRLAHR